MNDGPRRFLYPNVATTEHTALRDTIAIAAMQSLISGQINRDYLAERAYWYADQMMLQRDKDS